MTKTQPSIAIIGAGLSGLACAHALTKAGLQYTLYEAAEAPGGRVRSDIVDGFTLDRGFQVLLPSYPEARRLLDYEALKLRPFYRGCEVFYKGRFHRLADPFTHPSDAIRNTRDPFVSWLDKWRTIVLRKEVLTTRKIERRIPEMETEDYLRDFGFSEEYIDRFFRTFFGGVFLEKDLRTSARMFLFLYSMFSTGGAVLPAHGMQAIPDQLAAGLPPGALKLNNPVTSISAGEFTLGTGETIRPDHLIMAVSEEVAARLLPESTGEKLLPARSTTCLYFTTDQALPDLPIIHLDGDGRGPVNSASVLSKVSPHYAPPGQHLISASIIGSPSSGELEGVVRDQMVAWFGPNAVHWNLLKTYQIRHALPEGRQLRLGAGPLSPVLAPGLYRCGDWCEDASINGALISGRRAAEAVIESLA